jgi:aspartyl-tRNA(Asn)/glutamyl-tRNA(Gln) amidotransferase subunit A
MTITEAAAALRARKVSSVELTTAALARIEKLNPKLNAFLTVTADAALDRARLADRELASGKDRGLLHGIPIAHKDLIYTRGVRTTGGSKLFENFIPDHDAAVVEKLNAAGAVSTGKLGMHELAYGITSNNHWFGAVRNPWDTDRIPGGSSGGSGAAVVADMVFAAMGSDTGGSIRIPASFCGCVGFKPTYGRVSRHGVMPLGYTLDHLGPLTRTVRDAALVLNAIAGADPRDAACSRRPVPDYLPPHRVYLNGLRAGLPDNFYFDRVDQEVQAAVRNTARKLESLGAQVEPVTVPNIAELNIVSQMILLAEASAALEPYWSRRADFSPEALALFDLGRFQTATDYVQAQRLRLHFRREFNALFQKVDVLLVPTTPTTAPKIGETTLTIDGATDDVRLASTRLVRGINVFGLPALSLPAGLSTRNLPLGLQVIGKAWHDSTVLRVGAAIEDLLGPAKLPGL